MSKRYHVTYPNGIRLRMPKGTTPHEALSKQFQIIMVPAIIAAVRSELEIIQRTTGNENKADPAAELQAARKLTLRIL